VICHGVTLAETRQGKRVLETSHPPTYYFPGRDVKQDYLEATVQEGLCEWKGIYQFYDVRVGSKGILRAAWRCIKTTPDFLALQDHYAFYPALMDACYVDDERVIPQPGNFYGGWITSEIVGPFKGGPGTWGW
jgi:uncharacterized protein (DUF427 family)